MRNSKKALVLIGFVLVFCLGNFLMNLALVEPSYMGINYRVLKEEGPFDILLFGTSHGQSGIVPEKLEQETGMKTMNLCVAGEYAKDSYYMPVSYTHLDVYKRQPSTGITLPLISYGGSSVVSTMLIIGVIQGLHLMKQREVEEIEYAAAAQDEEDPEEDFEGRR